MSRASEHGRDSQHLFSAGRMDDCCLPPSLRVVKGNMSNCGRKRPTRVGHAS